MRNTNVRWVIILGAISILSIIAMQSYWLIQRQTHESQSFHQTTTIGLLKVAQKMAVLNKLTLPSGEIIKRITPNYYIVNYNNEIDAKVLEHYLLENSVPIPITLILNMGFLIVPIMSWSMEITAT